MKTAIPHNHFAQIDATASQVDVVNTVTGAIVRHAFALQLAAVLASLVWYATTMM